MATGKCPLDNNDAQKDDYGNLGIWRCKNLQEVGGDMERETYACAVCGERFSIYYEDMQ